MPRKSKELLKSSVPSLTHTSMLPNKSRLDLLGTLVFKAWSLQCATNLRCLVWSSRRTLTPSMCLIWPRWAHLARTSTIANSHEAHWKTSGANQSFTMTSEGVTSNSTTCGRIPFMAGLLKRRMTMGLKPLGWSPKKVKEWALQIFSSTILVPSTINKTSRYNRMLLSNLLVRCRKDQCQEEAPKTGNQVRAGEPAKEISSQPHLK